MNNDTTISILFPKTNMQGDSDQVESDLCMLLMAELVEVLRDKKEQAIFVIKDIDGDNGIFNKSILKAVGGNKSFFKKAFGKNNSIKIKDYMFQKSAIFDIKRQNKALENELLREVRQLKELFFFECNKALIKKIQNEMNYSHELSYFKQLVLNAVKISHSEKLPTKTITIQILHACDSLMTSLAHHHHIGHLIILKSPASECYSTLLTHSTHHILDETGVDSLTVISDESYKTQGDKYKEELLGHFFYDRQIYKINRSVLFEKRSIAMKKWVRYYYSPPSCFFSYGEKDNCHEFMNALSKSLKEYIPPLSIRKDKEIDNFGANIDEISRDLYNSQIVYFIVGRNFLHSFFAMREITRVFKRKFSEGSKIYTQNDVENFFMQGVIVILLEDAYNFVYKEGNKITDIWMKIKSSNVEHNNEEIEEIVDGLELVEPILKSAYQYKNPNKHMEEKFRTVAYITSKAISHIDAGYYHDFYGGYDAKLFPPPGDG